MRTRLLAACATVLLATHGAQAADLTVSGAFSRATPGTAAPAVAYLTIHGGDAPDRLVAVASPSGEVQMHTMEHDGTIMRMRQIDGIDIPAGGTVTLAPGGLHLMVMGLKAPLKRGDALPLTLRFQHAGDRQLQVPIEAIGAMAPPKSPP